MDDFLTTRQTQDILKVDRITIYRMLNDGRLKGTKIGQQWRFPRIDVENLLSGIKHVEDFAKPAEDSSLPVHCLQTIQDLFSAVSQYSAVLINPQGSLITEISHPCSLCQIFQSNPIAAEVCKASRVDFMKQARNNSRRFVCHAGLHYVGMPVMLGNEVTGLFLVGGYKLDENNASDTETLYNQLSKAYGITLKDIKKSQETIPVLHSDQEEKLETWAAATAQAFESILQERSAFAWRLKKIADLTQIS